MQEQEAEAQNAITQWQESFTESEDARSRMEREMEAMKAKLSDTIEDETGDEQTKDELVIKLQETEALLREANKTLSSDEDIVHQWEGKPVSFLPFPASQDLTMQEHLYSMSVRVEELVAQVSVLEDQLREQEQDARGTISQWQESYNAAEERCSEVSIELEKVKQQNQEAAASSRTEINGLQATVDALEKDITNLRSSAADVDTREEENKQRSIELEQRLVEKEEELTEAREDVAESAQIRRSLEGKMQRGDVDTINRT